MSFLFYHLLTNPPILQQAQREVDEIVGSSPIKVEHLSKLPYITACLREALRSNPPIPSTVLGPLPGTKEDPVTLGGGKYLVKPGTKITYLMEKVHHDPKVYGEDANKFRPERMVDEQFNKLPKNAWKVSIPRLVNPWLTYLISPLESVREHALVEVSHCKKLLWSRLCCFNTLTFAWTIPTIDSQSMQP